VRGGRGKGNAWDKRGEAWRQRQAACVRAAGGGDGKWDVITGWHEPWRIVCGLGGVCMNLGERCVVAKSRLGPGYASGTRLWGEAATRG
jgi:hypothetical protein